MAAFRFVFSPDKTPQLFNPLISQVTSFGWEGVNRRIQFALGMKLIFATRDGTALQRSKCHLFPSTKLWQGQFSANSSDQEFMQFPLKKIILLRA